LEPFPKVEENPKIEPGQLSLKDKEGNKTSEEHVPLWVDVETLSGHVSSGYSQSKIDTENPQEADNPARS